MSFCLRKMMSLSVLAFWIFGANPSAMAETASAERADARVSEAELRTSLRTYQNMSQLDVDFQQLKTLKDMRRPLRSKGHLTVNPPESVIYQLITPSALTVKLTAKKITIESGRGSETSVQVLDVASLQGSKEHRNLQAMVSWLQMDPHALAAAYRVTRPQPTKFHFAPVVANESPFAALDLSLNGNGDATDLVMREASGDQIEFIFSPPKVRYKK